MAFVLPVMQLLTNGEVNHHKSFTLCNLEALELSFDKNMNNIVRCHQIQCIDIIPVINVILYYFIQ